MPREAGELDQALRRDRRHAQEHAGPARDQQARVASSLMERHTRPVPGRRPRQSALRFAQLAESMFPTARSPARCTWPCRRTGASPTKRSAPPGTRAGPPPSPISTPSNGPRSSRTTSPRRTTSGVFGALVAAIDNRGYSDAALGRGRLVRPRRRPRTGEEDILDVRAGARTTTPQAEARFRLAQIFQAQGDYASAESLYKSLRETKGSARRAVRAAVSGAIRRSCPWRAVLPGGQPGENDDEAEQLLLSVVDGSVVALMRPEFREAPSNWAGCTTTRGRTGVGRGGDGTPPPRTPAGDHAAGLAPGQRGGSGGKFREGDRAPERGKVRRYPNDRRRTSCGTGSPTPNAQTQPRSPAISSEPPAVDAPGTGEDPLRSPSPGDGRL